MPKGISLTHIPNCDMKTDRVFKIRAQYPYLGQRPFLMSEFAVELVNSKQFQEIKQVVQFVQNEDDFDINPQEVLFGSQKTPPNMSREHFVRVSYGSTGGTIDQDTWENCYIAEGLLSKFQDHTLYLFQKDGTLSLWGDFAIWSKKQTEEDMHLDLCAEKGMNIHGFSTVVIAEGGDLFTRALTTYFTFEFMYTSGDERVDAKLLKKVWLLTIYILKRLTLHAEGMTKDHQTRPDVLLVILKYAMKSKLENRQEVLLYLREFFTYEEYA